MNYKIALIRGDGIGPEVVGEAVKVLEAVGQKFGHSFTYEAVSYTHLTLPTILLV